MTFVKHSFGLHEFRKSQTKIVCNEVVSNLRLEVRAALYPPRISEYFCEGVLLYTRWFLWVSQSFKSSWQKFADSTVEKQTWDRLDKIERLNICCLLERYHWTFKLKNSFAVPFWNEPIMQLLRQTVDLTR